MTSHRHAEQSAGTLLAAACHYVSLGYRIMAAASGSKVPATAHGLLDATTDPEVLVRWWHRHPERNVAIVTGPEVVVIDVDGQDNHWPGDPFQMADLMTAAIAVTPRGGRHYYFRGAPLWRCSAGKLAPGVDVRAKGGYVIAPPSRLHTGGQYRWLPGHELPPVTELPPVPVWLSNLLDRVSGSRAGKPLTLPTEDTTDLIPAGQRNAVLTSIAGAMRRRGLGADAITAALLIDNAHRCRPPLPEAEVRRIAASVARYAPAPDVSPLFLHGVGSEADSAPPAEPTQPAWPTLHPDAWHGLAGDIVRAIAPATEADPVAILIQLLAAFGSLVGRNSFVRVEADLHFPTLFAVLVGDSAKARKGTSWTWVRSLLAEVEPVWADVCIASGLSSGEGVIWHVRDATESDPGVADKRLFIIEPEFAAVLRHSERQGNILTAVLRQAWDGARLRTMTRHHPATATGAHLAVVGHITEAELRRYLHATETANGFANRFLWLCVRRSQLLPRGGRPQQLEQFVIPLRQAYRKAQQPREIDLTPEADALWRENYARLSTAQPGMAGALLARSEAQTLRLALLYALLDSADAIQQPHLAAALAVRDYVAQSVTRLFGDTTGDDLADAILQALRDANGGLRQCDLNNLFGGHRSSARIQTALQALRRTGLIVSQKMQTNGRAALVWKLAPAEEAE